LLHLATVAEGDLILTEQGREFADVDVAVRKQIIRRELLEIPLFRLIERVLASKSNHAMSKDFFIDILEEHFSKDQAERQLMLGINWGRFADLFHYDTDSELLYLAEDQLEDAEAVHETSLDNKSG
jgi:NitT/TauT family transport system ATP-binding protein